MTGVLPVISGPTLIAPTYLDKQPVGRPLRCERCHVCATHIVRLNHSQRPGKVNGRDHYFCQPHAAALTDAPSPDAAGTQAR